MHAQDYARLHREVCDHPDEDAPRLAFADLIEPQDAEYAEFIRIQVEVAADARMRDVDRPLVLPLDAWQLLRRRGREWAGEISRHTVAFDADSPGYRFYRGFVAHVRLRPETFVEKGAEIFSAAPIRHLDVHASAAARASALEDCPLGTLLESPLLSQLDSLGIVGRVTPEDFKTLAHSPRLTRCRYLDIARTFLCGSEETYRVLAASPLGKRLRSLNKAPGGPLGERPQTDEDGNVFHGPPSAFAKELIAAHGDHPWFHVARFRHRYLV